MHLKRSISTSITKVKSTKRRFRGTGRTRLSVINERLASQINFQQIVENNPVIEIKDGIAVNMDYSNPQHLKWLED